MQEISAKGDVRSKMNVVEKPIIEGEYTVTVGSPARYPFRFNWPYFIQLVVTGTTVVFGVLFYHFLYPVISAAIDWLIHLL
jgi:hypothetical protein